MYRRICHPSFLWILCCQGFFRFVEGSLNFVIWVILNNINTGGNNILTPSSNLTWYSTGLSSVKRISSKNVRKKFEKSQEWWKNFGASVLKGGQNLPLQICIKIRISRFRNSCWYVTNTTEFVISLWTRKNTFIIIHCYLKAIKPQTSRHQPTFLQKGVPKWSEMYL